MPKNKSKKPAIKMPPMPDTHEQRLYDFVSTVGDWIWETNTLLEFTYVSERFEALTGLEESFLLGTTLSQLVLGFPKVSAKNKTIFNLDNKAPFHEIACSLVSESGAIMHFSLSGTPFYDSDGLFCGYRGAAHNITDKLSTYRMPKLAAQDPDAPANETPNPGEAEATEAFVIYDKAGNVIGASESYLQLYPDISDMIIPGATLKDILTETVKRIDIPEAKTDPEKWVQEKLEERLRAKTGTKEIFRHGRWWRMHESLTSDGNVLCMHTDITDLKNMETSLLDAETRYRKLVELAPDLTCVITDGIITLMNSAGANVLGFDSSEELLGTAFHKYVHPDFEDIIRHELESLLEEKWMPIRLVHHDGHIMDAELAAMPLSRNTAKTVMLVARDTSDRKRSVEALIARDEHLRSVMDTVVDGIISIDKNGIIQSFNKSAERIFGYPAHEVIGKNVKMLMPEPQKSEHDGYLDNYLTTGNAKIIGFGREVTGLKKDGHEFPMDLAVSEMRRDGVSTFIGVVRDITERKKSEESLHDSRERLALAIEGSGEGIWDWDARSDLIYISPKIQEMFGIVQKNIRPKEWQDYIHPDDTKIFQAALVDYLNEQTTTLNIECRFLDPDKNSIWVRISGKALRNKTGRAYRISGSVADITQRVVFENEIIGAKERAEVANRVKTEFLANMSHELRTPLNAIIGFSDVMVSALFGKLDSHYDEYAHNIRDSGQHLLGVINDILDVSRVETGNLEIRSEAIAVLALVDSAMRLVRDRAHAGDLKLIKDIENRLPEVSVDTQRMKQVLINVLSNAVKFTPEGGSVTISAKRETGGGIIIAIKDTGIGMAEEDIEIALTPFGQVDSRLQRKYEGTGLGLPLSKNLIELHSGTIDIKSNPKVGTTVFLTIPAERVID